MKEDSKYDNKYETPEQIKLRKAKQTLIVIGCFLLLIFLSVIFEKDLFFPKKPEYINENDPKIQELLKQYGGYSSGENNEEQPIVVPVNNDISNSGEQNTSGDNNLSGDSSGEAI